MADSLRDQAIEAMWVGVEREGPNVYDLMPFALDALLDWLETNAHHVAHELSEHWVSIDSIELVAAVLREADE